MINRIIGKLISAVICAVFLGLLVYTDLVRKQQMGKETFLANEAMRYDRHIAHPNPLVVEIIAALFILGIMFVIYEAIAFAIFKILEQTNSTANSQVQNRT